MSYEFLDDVAIADVAFKARGSTLVELCTEAARATINVMIEDLGAIRPKERREIKVRADAPEFLLFDLLQEIIYYKDAEQLLLAEFDLEVREEEDGFELRGYAMGEILDPERHEQVVDVKAVTMHQFQVARDADGWSAFVILDI